MDVFCKIIAGELDANIAYQDEYVLVIMDANPISPGHVLIIPKKHYTTILDLDDEIASKIHSTAKKMIKMIEEKYPDVVSVKIGVNYGESQIVKHYHMHLLPIYKDNKKPEMTQKELCELLKR